MFFITIWVYWKDPDIRKQMYKGISTDKEYVPHPTLHYNIRTYVHVHIQSPNKDKYISLKQGYTLIRIIIFIVYIYASPSYIILYYTDGRMYIPSLPRTSL